MNTEESTLFFNLKQSINSMLQQQVNILQRSILTCEQMTGKDPKELQSMNDLIESSQYICEIQSDCKKIKNELKTLMTKMYSRPKSSESLNTLNNLSQSVQLINPLDMSIISIDNKNTFQEPILNQSTIQQKLVKNVYGCYRYPYDYFNKKILGYSQPYQNLLLLKFVPEDKLKAFRKFKLEEFSKFEELTGLTVPKYFQSEEFFQKGCSHKQYKLSRIEQKQLYDMYYSKYFASYTDIAIFHTLQTACGISKNIYLYEQYLLENSNQNQ